MASAPKVVFAPENSPQTRCAADQILESDEFADSSAKAQALFAWIIAPCTVQEFFRDYFEQKPLVVHRKDPAYFDGLFHSGTIAKILQEQELHFGTDLDVTNYVDGKRVTLNPEGNPHATPSTVWDFVGGPQSCSLRMLRPQEYDRRVWHVLHMLDQVFQSQTGCNAYLTPARAQGFAPHFDDVDVFLCQMEGSKHWRIHNPPSPSDVLARFSSPNFDQSELDPPIMHLTLQRGDLLYMPRGTVHQAISTDDQHSFHITLSACQKHTWADFLSLALPGALELAAQDDIDFRRSLPRTFLDYMGVVHQDQGDSDEDEDPSSSDPRRRQFRATVQSLVSRLSQFLPCDDAVDQFSKRILHGRVPPVLTQRQQTRSTPPMQISAQTTFRLLHKGIARLIIEDSGDVAVLCHIAQNSRVFQQNELAELEFSVEFAPALEQIIGAYPRFVSVGGLVELESDERLQLVELLAEERLLEFI